VESRGEFPGRIAFEAAGDNGFGYDPLFFLDDVGRTCAQLDNQEKSRRSHRGQAARRLAELLSATKAAVR
jgi:XTP/dITP diphosphohydrolase